MLARKSIVRRARRCRMWLLCGLGACAALARLARSSEQGWLLCVGQAPLAANARVQGASERLRAMLKTRLLSAELLATNAKTAAKSQLAALKTLACRQPLRRPRPAAGGLRRPLPERSRRGRAQRPATTRVASAIFGQPRNACLPPTGTARPAGQPAATRAALGTTALGPSQRNEPAEGSHT